jgi:hypothetical protein
LSLTNWLKKRLTPVKGETTRWAELAEALEEYFTTYLDPYFNGLVKARSIYTAESDDQLKIIAELGGYFEDDMPSENRPVLVAQRKMDLMQKETDVPLKSVLARLGIGVTWEPLYMLPHASYGNVFYTEYQLSTLGVSADQCLLTSRGCLAIDISQAPVSDDAANVAIRRCQDILPLHIVFQSCRLFASIETIDIPTIVTGGLSGEIITVYPF